MKPGDLSTLCRGYIRCLNARDWSSPGRFVAGDVSRNGRPLELSGYRRMLEDDVEAI